MGTRIGEKAMDQFGMGSRIGARAEDQIGMGTRIQGIHLVGLDLIMDFIRAGSGFTGHGNEPIH